MRRFIIDFLKRLFLALASTLGIFVLFGLVLDYMESLVNGQLYGVLGGGAILFTAIIGTPLHETAHWLGCKLFGFQVHEFVPLRPLQYRNDGILGYVSYSYNVNSWWQKLGCVFTGMAPMIFGAIFILIVVWLLTPEVLQEIKFRISKIYKGRPSPSIIFRCWWEGFAGFWAAISRLRQWGILRGAVCLYFVMSISMHMTMSMQDIKGAMAGAGILLLIYAVYALLTTVLDMKYTMIAANCAAFLSAILSIGLIFDGALLILSAVLNQIHL